MRLLLAALACTATVAACGAPGAAQGSASSATPTPSCAPLAARSPRPGGSPPAGFAPSGQGRALASGQVTAYSGGVMTVDDRRSGQAVKVTVDSSTEVSTGFGAGGSSGSSIAKGENVSVFGSQNADGTITASRVMVLPAAANPACARRPRGSPSPQA